MHYIPTYVYVVLCVLLYVGVRRCYPRTTRPERTIVFPLVFLALGAASLERLFPSTPLSTEAISLATLGVGVLFGYWQASRWRMQFEFDDGRIMVRLPGDPSLLVTLLLSFALKFAQQYELSVHAPWSASPSFEILSYALWGALTGMPLGRSLNVLLRAARARHPDQTTPTFG